jgi:hypothetical protein
VDEGGAEAHCETMKRVFVVLAVIAALMIVGLGTAVATTLVTSAAIQDHTIRNVDISSAAVDGRVVKDKSISSADLAPKARASWARVSASGTVVRSSGGVSASSLGIDGQYSVNFGRDVSKCAYSGTIDSGAIGNEGQVNATPRAGNARAVFVQTVTLTPSPVDADLPFYLAVFC